MLKRISKIGDLFLGLGNLNNNGNAGLSCLNANNGISNSNWNILARNSRCKIIKKF